jgi:hypothetical protein
MGWNDYAKTAEVGTGEWPEIPDDVYDAIIADVGEPETRPDHFNPEVEKTDFRLKWELISDELPENTWLYQWVTLPEGFLANGTVHKKSNLYAVMEALGFDMTGKFEVDPLTWQGMQARAVVKNAETAEGAMRPRIKSLMPAKKGRQLVAAGVKKPTRDNGAFPDLPED